MKVAKSIVVSFFQNSGFSCEDALVQGVLEPFGANKTAFRINLMIERTKAKTLIERLRQ